MDALNVPSEAYASQALSPFLSFPSSNPLPPFPQVIVMTVVISLLYYAGGSTSQQEIQNVTGALFFITLFLAFNGVFQVRLLCSCVCPHWISFHSSMRVMERK